MAILLFTCIPHAAWIPRHRCDPAEGLLGLASIRYYRFGRQVSVDRFRLCPTVLRWAPPAYARPDHVTIARFQKGSGWETLYDEHLPVIEPEAWHEIELGGVATDHLRIICDSEHPAEECHGDFAYATWNVPFRILEKVEFRGTFLTDGQDESPYEPKLRIVKMLPRSLPGIDCRSNPHEVRFGSSSFQVAFSLLRPIITHLSWDVLAGGLVDRSLVCLDSRLANRLGGQWPSDLASGPWFSGLHQEGPCMYWGGEVTVIGNKVSYSNLKLIDGLLIDAVFTIHHDGMDLSIRQRAQHDLHALEFEPWRMIWKGDEAITGTLAVPVEGAGRTGQVTLPALWSAPGHGTLHVRQTSGQPAILQVDSIRDRHVGMSGFMLGIEHDQYGMVTIQRGEYHANFSLRSHELLPRLNPGVKQVNVAPGLRRNWSTAFTFRPEFGGISNNCMSSITLMTIHAVVDSCAMTPVVKEVPSMLELARYTMRLSMKGGPGYGENRRSYMDTDPSQLCATGRIYQAEPDRRWLTEMCPWIRATAGRILAQIDERGLYLCRQLSGNSGSCRWSTNAFDVVSFGHYDAYSNALAYRGLLNAVAMLHDAGDKEATAQCRTAAEGIKAAYSSCFLNPETGWLAGWRSRDGNLHDYAFTFINNMAICLGLVSNHAAKQILERLENKRREIGFDAFYYGLPPNLLPLPQKDVPVEQQGRRADGRDMYGFYLNGSATTYFMEYYIGALDQCGFDDTADRVCRDLEESLAENRIVGGIFSGTEFFAWYGAPCGYEGVLQGQFRIMLALAQYRGWVPSFKPQWWPCLA